MVYAVGVERFDAGTDGNRIVLPHTRVSGVLKHKNTIAKIKTKNCNSIVVSVP